MREAFLPNGRKKEKVKVIDCVPSATRNLRGVEAGKGLSSL